jgi:uncharacterized protein (TIGR02452 family)
MIRQNRKECLEIFADTLAKLDPKDPSIENTVVYGPQDVKRLLMSKFPMHGETRPEVRIVNLGTVEAADLATKNGVEKLALLVFASAKNPGGGVVNGQPRGQEESLCRSSGLFPCIRKLKIYDLAKSNNMRCLYQDFVVFSPEVPVIKNGNGEPLEKPFKAAFLTCPAPNGKAALSKGVKIPEIRKTMERRIDAVLAVAASHGIKNLVLGAWGTGCFGGSPEHVAKAFKWAIAKFPFDNIIFAITDPDQVEIFKKVFS